MDRMRKQNQERYADSFVNDILGGESQCSENRSVMHDDWGSTLVAPWLRHGEAKLREEGGDVYGRFNGHVGPGDNVGRFSFGGSKYFSSFFGYSLIFINFTFIMASILLIMSAVVARENAALRLCASCGKITIAALVLGIILWILTIFGFIWIRQGQMLFLLVYVVFLIGLFFALLILIFFAAVYDREVQFSFVNPENFLQMWEAGVNKTFTGENYDICHLQELYNCSGFHYGCCVPGICYNSSASPKWIKKVCPSCPMFPPMFPVVCTSAVYMTVRKNLGGFLVISVFSLVLVVSGIVFAFISRRAVRLLITNEG